MLMYYCVCVCAASQRLLMNQMPPIAFFFYIVALTISILFVLYFLKQTIRNLVRHTAAMHQLSLCSTLSFPLTDK